MKKALVTIIVVLAMFAMFVGTAAAAPLTAGTVTLVSVEYAGGTPVFIFSVSGEFSNADLKGSIHIEGGEDFDLHCAQIDSSTVRCTTSRAAAGKNVVIFWNGQTFWASVPAAKAAPESFCYNMYDWNPPPPPFTSWVNAGSYCQETPAQYGDVINWYNPDWGAPYDYEFMPQSPTDPLCTFSPINEDAYYFPICPPSIPL